MKTCLTVMAAGIGSRFGKGIKQLEPVGPRGEIIMDYSIYDAIRAGFNKVVFIIRKDLYKDFRNIIGNRIEKKIEVEYAFQELDMLPQSYKGRWERVKPWGTGHAVLSASEQIHEPFMVINADDYYGRESFLKMHDYMVSNMSSDKKTSPMKLCMAGFELVNTLSEHGGVTRGICSIKDGFMSEVDESFDVRLSDGIIKAKDRFGNPKEVPIDSYVSMNMWGFTPEIFNILKENFEVFLENLSPEDIKSEYLLPDVIGKLVHDKKAQVEVVKTSEKWFGVTYKEDIDYVMDSIRSLIKQGIYE
jgi:hypothetical protein